MAIKQAYGGGIGRWALALLLLAAGCDRPSGGKPNNGGGAPAASNNTLELVFPFGSEKKAWITEATDAFNAAAHATADGKTIRVKAIAMGSGESKDDILSGRLEAHLWSPASGVFVAMGNAEAQVKGAPLVERTEELVLSPVVIAMWRPQAEALGWPNKPVGWSDVLALAKDPRGWGSRGRPEWGPFRFGHTHPEYSNSGIISVLAETYAAAGKVRDLSQGDLARPEVAAYLREIESSVVHYGRSTGFFGQALAKSGPSYLSAAVLYENMVIEANSQGELEAPLVSIYPKEGTFWSDHPIGVVNRPWVTDAHRAAAKLYIEHLLSPQWQTRALAHGFRPAKGAIGAPIDLDHGADPAQPKTVLETPSAKVIDGVIKLWRANKKPSDVVLVFDKSGSMREENKLANAKAGARELIGMMDDRDWLAVVPFSNDVVVVPGGELSGKRGEVLSRIDGLVAAGDTRLYAATERAYDELVARRATPAGRGRIAAIVVLTDGEDNDHGYPIERLLDKLSGRLSEGDTVRIFTIGYGSDARMDVLKKIGERAHGQTFEGKVDNIREVFREIATFF